MWDVTCNVTCQLGGSQGASKTHPPDPIVMVVDTHPQTTARSFMIVVDFMFY